MEKFAIGVDIGGSHICGGMLNLSSGKIIKHSIVVECIDNKMSGLFIIKALAEVIAKVILLSDREPLGIGLAFPGPFDYKRGVCLIESTEKFNGLWGMNVSSTLQAYLSHVGTYRIQCMNDAGAFILGETLGGVARNAGRVVGITLGTGVGSAFVAEGWLVEEGPGVPSWGWVYHLPFENGTADEAFSTRWFCRRYKQLCGRDIKGVRELVNLAEADLVLQIFGEYGCRLADFLSSVCLPFGADMVVLGGNIARTYPLFRAALDARLSAKGVNLNIRLSGLYERAAIVGAASLFCTDKLLCN